MKRRPVSPFSLSFLDIMFCGFGAVVLLVLIMNADTVKARNETFADLRADVMRREQEVLVGREYLVDVRNSLDASEKDLVVAEGEAQRVLRTIRELELEIADLSRESLARRQHANKLKSDLKHLDSETKRLGAERADQRDRGERVRRFLGDGDRQYLTGLKVGGKRILILLDASASMLDETIVNVIRRRNMDEERRRKAPKWRKALATVEWLVSNLPADARFQIYTFNTGVKATVPASEGKWLPVSNKEDLERAAGGLLRIIPEGGTSLYQAFTAVGKLSPKPDNILLVTDGLPTQGRRRPAATTVSAEKRLGHFMKARGILPSRIPVNIILLPMEGDPFAAAAYWKLALDTQGSFLTPSRDWP